MIEAITNIDLAILLFVQEYLRTDVGNMIWKFITHLGDGGWLWITVGVILLFFKKTRVIGFSVLISLLINAIFTNITLKDLIARPRPFVICDAIETLIKQPSSYSFPSGHTSGSMTAALVLYKLTPKKYGIPAVILASLIALSRIYVGVHYPTDVLGGLVIAFVSSLWGCYLVKCMYIRMKERSCHD
ncbi:MAG: phosphatase PAP2 family protein [Faecalimonas sp.]|nr:phosphatase PAP2 family protein [Faecalimonas sp.]